MLERDESCQSCNLVCVLILIAAHHSTFFISDIWKPFKFAKGLLMEEVFPAVLRNWASLTPSLLGIFSSKK